MYEVNGFPSIEMSTRRCASFAMTRIRSAVEFCFAVALRDKIEVDENSKIAAEARAIPAARARIGSWFASVTILVLAFADLRSQK
jgi:hypothetical protein